VSLAIGAVFLATALFGYRDPNDNNVVGVVLALAIASSFIFTGFRRLAASGSKCGDSHSPEEMEAPPFPTTIGTRKLKIYTVISITTVLLAVVEGGQHMGLYGFVAIFICQPWLIVGWLLEANGVVSRLPDLNAFWVAALSGLNILLWAALLILKHRLQK
jgi:hypothetical protein